MARNRVYQERLQALMRELLLEEVAAGELSIDDIEEAMVELGLYDGRRAGGPGPEGA